jgi:hypothetical protein
MAYSCYYTEKMVLPSEIQAALNILLWTLYYESPFVLAVFMHMRRLVLIGSALSRTYIAVQALGVASSLVAGIGVALAYNGVSALPAVSRSDEMYWQATVCLALVVPPLLWGYVLTSLPDGRKRRTLDMFFLMGAFVACGAGTVLTYLLKSANVVGNYLPGGLTTTLWIALSLLSVVRAYDYSKKSAADDDVKK